MATFNGDFDVLFGEYNATLPTLTDGDPSRVQLDSSGRLIIAGLYDEDSAHTTGDLGLQMLAVRADSNGTLVSADGDYAPLQVDADGFLKVAGKITVEAGDAEYLEDSAHTSGDAGIQILAVRQDTLAASTSTDGDYSSLKVDADGELYVADVTVRNTLSSIDSTLSSIDTSTSSIDTEIQSLTHAEDSAHISGNVGMMPLAVRADADGTLADTDGDYAPIQVATSGKVKVESEAKPIGDESYAPADAFTAGADGLIAVTDTFTDVSTQAVAAGETAYLYGYQFDCDELATGRLIVDDGTNITVYKTRINTSAMPGLSEHFSEGGRIEIPGSATTTIKLQVRNRKNSATAQASGSMHIRIA